jgi:hypothetical protein
MPDLWDPNPDHVFNGSGTQPDSAPNGNHDHTKEVPLRDHRGRLRPPAYVLIALVIALVAIVVLLAGVLFAPD